MKKIGHRLVRLLGEGRRFFDDRSGRLRWYYARLTTMGPSELVYRVIEIMKKAAWRYNHNGWRNFAEIADGSLADFDFLRNRLASAVKGGACPGLVESVRLARAGHFELLGQLWPTAERGRWHDGRPPATFWLRDPIGGGVWPGADTYCFAINYRNTGLGGGARRGDVKYVWELNRLQFLHPIAAEIARTGDAALTRWSFRLLASWANAHPPFRSVNWVSGIELALRLVSLALLISAAGPTALEPDERILVRQLIAAHGFWLYRYHSRFSSANNHLVLEGLGLFIAGELAPDLPDAKRWVLRGRAILEVEASKQILDDGVGAEQSPTYQAFTMEALAFAVVLAEGIGTPLDRTVLIRLGLGAEYLRWLLDKSGLAPSIGDNDETRVIAQPPDREPRYIASIVAAIAGLTERPDLAPPDRDPHMRDAVFCTAWSCSDLADGMKVFPIGGYTAIRDMVGGHGIHLVFDHGPLGYLSLAAHGHADALAIWLTLDDQPIFVDAGTYLYYSAGRLRDKLRETAVHNTLMIAGQSQSRASGPFTWAGKARGRFLTSAPWPNWCVAGEHDGYDRSFGVRHQRRLAREEHGFIITDRLDDARQPLPVTIHFLCHPTLSASIRNEGIIIFRATQALVKIAPPSNFRVDVIIGEEGSGRGWQSPRFGEIIPAPLIVLSGKMTVCEKITRITIMPPAAL